MPRGCHFGGKKQVSQSIKIMSPPCGDLNHVYELSFFPIIYALNNLSPMNSFALKDLMSARLDFYVESKGYGGLIYIILLCQQKKKKKKRKEEEEGAAPFA